MFAKRNFFLAAVALAVAALPSLGADPEAIPRADTSCTLKNDCYPIGVHVTLHAQVVNAQVGHQHELRYQYRVHTKKGGEGPILGTKEYPSGRTVVLRAGTGITNFTESIDVTRGDLSGMTNWPKPRQNEASRRVFLRIEPQVYDKTAKVFLTPPKSNAIILVAQVDVDGYVQSLQSVAKWLEESQRLGSGDDLGDFANFLDLDAYDVSGNGIGSVFSELLRNNKVDDAQRLRYIEAITKDIADPHVKGAPSVRDALSYYSQSGSPLVQAAAQKKLDELSKK